MVRGHCSDDEGRWGTSRSPEEGGKATYREGGLDLFLTGGTDGTGSQNRQQKGGFLRGSQGGETALSLPYAEKRTAGPRNRIVNVDVEGPSRGTARREAERSQ